MSTETYTWHGLQEALMKCETEAEVQAIIDAEKAGECRQSWLIRARGRLRTLRRIREDAEQGV